MSPSPSTHPAWLVLVPPEEGGPEVAGGPDVAEPDDVADVPDEERDPLPLREEDRGPDEEVVVVDSAPEPPAEEEDQVSTGSPGWHSPDSQWLPAPQSAFPLHTRMHSVPRWTSSSLQRVHPTSAGDDATTRTAGRSHRVPFRTMKVTVPRPPGSG